MGNVAIGDKVWFITMDNSLNTLNGNSFSSMKIHHGIIVRAKDVFYVNVKCERKTHKVHKNSIFDTRTDAIMWLKDEIAQITDQWETEGSNA